MFYFTPLPGFFSPFPHGTGSLSVMHLYLALDDGPPGFLQDFSCLVVLRNVFSKILFFRVRGLHPLWRNFPEPFTKIKFYDLLAQLQ